MTFDKKKYILDLSLDEISSEIDPKNFFKTSRQCIISMKAIKSIIRLAGGRLRIETTPESSFEINVSRSRVDDFLLWIEN
jgi:DNA-binding LytR/AlgR family response regulator